MFLWNGGFEKGVCFHGLERGWGREGGRMGHDFVVEERSRREAVTKRNAVAAVVING